VITYVMSLQFFKLSRCRDDGICHLDQLRAGRRNFGIRVEGDELPLFGRGHVRHSYCAHYYARQVASYCDLIEPRRPHRASVGRVDARLGAGTLVKICGAVGGPPGVRNRDRRDERRSAPV
jgi:hypothetical protein